MLCDIIEEAMASRVSKKKGSAARKPTVPLPQTTLFEANTFLCYVYDRDFSIMSRLGGLALGRLAHKFHVMHALDAVSEFCHSSLISSGLIQALCDR